MASRLDCDSWLKAFLDARKVRQPDGRPLYAYRCKADEFETLRDVLRGPLHAYNNKQHLRAFVLYAAQWWQRQYDGRRWAWEPLLDSISWHVDYPDLYPDVRAAWRWWKIQPVRLPAGTRYLGTFACHGGLPLALIGDNTAPVTRYLRAVLNHVSEYGRFVEDPIDLAKDKEHLLRPPTLRRDHVFRLAADLIVAILDVRDHVDDDNPIAALDRRRPNWRESMPLDLDNALARDLLNSLLREALHTKVAHVNDFRVNRFLRYTSVGWRLGASVRLPVSISSRSLAEQLRHSTELPPRMEVRLVARGVHGVGVYRRIDDGDGDGDEEREYRLTGREAPLELWDADATGELRLGFAAGEYIGKGVVPSHGTGLSELPWAFRADEHECPFIGEGTVSSRAPKIMVLAARCDLPQAADATESEKDEVLGRVLWHVGRPVTIDTDFGPCTISPSAAERERDEYRFLGERWYDLDCRFPLFRGVPKLQVNKPDGLPRKVPDQSVQWRRIGGDWQPAPSGNGLWQVRCLDAGELRFHARVGLLPLGMSMKLEPGQTVAEGSFTFTGVEGMRLATDDAYSTVDGDQQSLRVQLRASTEPPTTVTFKLHWPPAPELVVDAPFPGRGGRFLRDGQPAGDRVAVDELYGMSAVALSPNAFDNFWITGSLKALDLGPLVKVAHFRRPLLRKTSALHEVSLIDVRDSIEHLLAASSDGDASVKLQVDCDGVSLCDLTVSRFSTEIKYDPQNTFVELSPPIAGGAPTVEAIPIARPHSDAVSLKMDGPSDGLIAALPEDFQYNEAWLVVARRDQRICAQPIAVSRPSRFASEVRDAATPNLAEAHLVASAGQRRYAVQQALRRMQDDGAENASDQEWDFLTDVLLSTTDLPASSIDVLVGLTDVPRLLVRCLFRLESAPRQRLWHLERELPFSWVLVKRGTWWREAKAAFEEVRDALASVGWEEAVASSRNRIDSVLDEGVDHNCSLRTVATDVSLRLRGENLSEDYARDRSDARDRATPDQIKLRNKLDDWLSGDGRKEWTESMGFPKLLPWQQWQKEGELAHRQPVFDTPVAAALYAFLPPAPTPRAIYLIKRAYFLDPDWFDLVYGAAWAELAVKADK